MGRRTNDELWAARQVPRKRGEGSVFPVVINGQDRFRATRTLFMDEKGNAVQVSGTGATVEEAVKRRDDNYKKRLVKMGELPASALAQRPVELKQTTAELLWEWHGWKKLQTTKSERISENVAAQYATLIRLHIAPAIGLIPIRLLSRKDIEKMLFIDLPAKRKMRKNKNGEWEKTDQQLIGASHLRAIQGVITMACKYAFEQRIISENPAIGVPKIDKPDSKSAEEQLEKKFWVAYRLAKNLQGNKDEARWLFTFLLAIRQSERLGLTWDCFTNLDSKSKTATPTVEIRQQLARHPDTGVLYIKKETKTVSGTRLIPLDARLVSIIKKHRDMQRELATSQSWHQEPGLENLVFTTENGKPIRHQTDTKQWRQLLKENNIPFLRQHAMRHIAISILVSENQPIEVIRAIAGHHSEAITRATYTHIAVKTKVAPMKSLTDKIFREREQTPSDASKE
jgi:integrase